MTTAGEANPGWPARAQAAWRTACELLEAGQYESAADLLAEVQAACEPMGETSLAPILAAARSVCLACGHYRSEAEWHQRSHRDAGQREEELKEQLQAIFDLVSGRVTLDTSQSEATPSTQIAEPSLPERDISETQQVRDLWQRVQSRLRRGSEPRLTQREASVLSDTPPALLPAERDESPIAVSMKRKDEDSLPSLVAYYLGPFRVYQDDQRIEQWPGNKCKCVFKYMIINRGRPIHQEVFMDLFWHDVDTEAARRNLYQAIYSLRQALQMGRTDFPHILCEDSCYSLNSEVEVWVDCEAFRMHDQDGRRLEQAGHVHEAVKAYELAENLYQGEFLAEDLYEDWTVVYRENLRHAHLDILDRLSQLYFDQGQLEKAISFCQKILAQDNCREDAHRRLMRCYIYQGQRHLALRQYHLCVETLKQELDVPPMPATLELYQKVVKNLAESPGSQKLKEN